jgi:hypothetical protein
MSGRCNPKMSFKFAIIAPWMILHQVCNFD